jgi:murein DD-endopeptidase MepM/ murein hydrolase activator NlpD
MAIALKQNIKSAVIPSAISGLLLAGCETATKPVPIDFSTIPTSSYLVSLETCPGLRVLNAPRTAGRGIVDFKPIVAASDHVNLIAAPVNRACLSSGFGPRNSSFHKGVDLASRQPARIVAAGNGTILEAKYQGSFGNMVLISHGDGIYTRYAHLETFSADLREGLNVSAGDFIGVTGTTGNARGRHLHYEVLAGNYRNSRKSFGLNPIDVFSLPEAMPDKSVGS